MLMMLLLLIQQIGGRGDFSVLLLRAADIALRVTPGAEQSNAGEFIYFYLYS
jgi:hypothetical protein